MSKSGLCLVTTEYPKLGPSGGIGTYVETVSNLMKSDVNVTILYAGQNSGTFETLKLDRNVMIVNLNRIHQRKFSGGTSYEYSQSLTIFDWLRSQNFEHVNFPDWRGLGFASIVAKKLNQDFLNTTLSVTMHGMTAWTKTGNQDEVKKFKFDLIEDLERYCIENCDIAISPTSYLAHWAKTNLNIQREIQILCNPFVPNFHSMDKIFNSFGSQNHISFFGRVEPRKGILEFLEAIDQIDPENTQINILGRNVMGDDVFNKYLDRRWYSNLRLWPDFTSQEALDFLEKTDSLVVVPSRIENCPYVIQELSNSKLRVLCSNSGGIVELIGEESVYDGSVETLAKLFLNYLSDKASIPRARSTQDFIENNSKWIQLFSSNHYGKKRSDSKPSIGIVIPHYNQSNYLRSSIDSIINQTYTNFKCVIVDDGSDFIHLEEFRRIANEIASDKIVFLEQKNQDVGQTRNVGVEKLDTDLVTFLDSDDILEKDFFERVSKIDFKVNTIVTSHFSIFMDDPKDSDNTRLLSGAYEPTGSISYDSWFRNILGGSNFVIDRSMFWSIGGFTTEPHQNHHDWRFLVRAQCLGAQIESLPYRVLNYRVRVQSMSRLRSHLNGHIQVVNEFVRSADHGSLRNVASQLMMSTISDVNAEMEFQFTSSTERLVRRIQSTALRVAPFGTRRWKAAIFLYRKLAK